MIRKKLKFLILTVLFCQCYAANAQVYNLHNDQKCLLCSPISFVPTNNINGREVEGKIEFSLWFRNLSDTVNSFVAVRQDRAGKWSGKKVTFFSWDWKEYKVLKEDTLVFDSEWNILWNELLSHNFLSLKTDSEAKQKWRRKPGDARLTVDGYQVCVEIRASNSCRQYQYANVSSFKEDYYESKSMNNSVFVIESLIAHFKLK